MNRSKRWLITYFSCVVVLMGIIAGVVAYVDPFMHYHKPFTDQFFYSLDNQRSQNDGIAKHNAINKENNILKFIISDTFL